jgi:hypothetical protein
VRDHDGKSLAYVYFENEPGRRSAAEDAHSRRGSAHRGEYCQAAGSCCSSKMHLNEEWLISMNPSTHFTAELDQTDEEILYEGLRRDT